MPRPCQEIVHGTVAGYHAHRRRGQPPCQACAAAHKAYDLERYHARTGKYVAAGRVRACGTDRWPGRP